MHAHHHVVGRLVACPECRRPAQILDRFTLRSTDGPLEHVKVRCGGGHWFSLPSDRLV